jgi:hypothetical protein
MFNYVPIKHKQMSFVSNGGKFKLYTVLNGLIFPMPTHARISFERTVTITEFGQSLSFNIQLTLAVNQVLYISNPTLEFLTWMSICQ